MNDILDQQPPNDCLFEIASSQQGYFTSSQAIDCGVSASLLGFRTQSKQYIHPVRGVYRLKHYPSSTREDVVVAWLAIGKEKAVVSHESALDLHELSDVIPHKVHITVPRTLRTVRKIPGVQVHSTIEPLMRSEITTIDGVYVTSVPRTIVDAATAGVGPEQIEMAIHQALARGITTRRRIQEAARNRSQRVQHLVENALRWSDK